MFFYRPFSPELFDDILVLPKNSLNYQIQAIWRGFLIYLAIDFIQLITAEERRFSS